MRKQELHPRTAVINKSQKNKSKQARHTALAWLTQRFPQAFDNSICIRPLKEGVMNDILQFAEEAEVQGISKSKLREAVVVFTRRIDYLTCLKVRDMRIDLEGNPVTQVTPEEAERAAIKIKKRVENSARNARKIMNSKMQTIEAPTAPLNQELRMTAPYYPERPPAFSSQAPATMTKNSSVIIKHKTTRHFDPDAVAKLKEKLGLRRAASTVETIE